MSPRHRPPTLQEAARADVEQGQAHWERPNELLPWDTRLVRKAKRWTRVAGAVGGLLAAASGAAVTVKGYATKLWQVVTRGTPAPAELPKTGVNTVATDFVSKPTGKP